MHQSIKSALVLLSINLAGTVHAATSVFDTFDSDIGNWIQNTIQTTVGHAANGGNPGGYLTTNNLSSNNTFEAIGAQNTSDDYSGEFADGLWKISVDLSFVNGDFTDSWLRFRFMNPIHNGWHISLADSGFFDETWQSYSVTFNTTWDDTTAMANGWIKEEDGGVATPSFSVLWDDVYNSEVRILGEGRLVAGIDNYRATMVPAPAALWLFGSGLLALAGAARNRNRSLR